MNDQHKLFFVDGVPRIKNATNGGYRSSVSDMNKLEKKYGRDATMELNSVATK